MIKMVEYMLCIFYDNKINQTSLPLAKAQIPY